MRKIAKLQNCKLQIKNKLFDLSVLRIRELIAENCKRELYYYILYYILIIINI